GAFGALRVVCAVGRELVRRDDRQQLLAHDRVALFHEEPADLAADLRTDDDVVGGYDAGENQDGRPRDGHVVGARAQQEDDEDERRHDPPAGHAPSTASPRAISSWMCRTYASGGVAANGIDASAAIRRRKSAVAKKKTRLPSRLRCVMMGWTGREPAPRRPRPGI